MFSSTDPFLHPSISAGSPLPAHLRLPLIMKTRIDSWLLCFYRHVLFVVAKIIMRHLIIKPMWLCLCLCSSSRNSVLSSSAWLCVQLFVRPAAQEKSRVEWFKASFLSAHWRDWGLFIAVFADRDVNIQLNKTSDHDEYSNPPTHFSQNPPHGAV